MSLLLIEHTKLRLSLYRDFVLRFILSFCKAQCIVTHGPEEKMPQDNTEPAESCKAKGLWFALPGTRRRQASMMSTSNYSGAQALRIYCCP
jgi:hypothetical protein